MELVRRAAVFYTCARVVDKSYNLLPKLFITCGEEILSSVALLCVAVHGPADVEGADGLSRVAVRVNFMLK